MPLTFALLACLAACTPQANGASDSDAIAAALKKFEALPALRQAMVVRSIEKQLAESDDASVRRIQALQQDPGQLADSPPPVFFDPQEWTNGVAPPRYVIPHDDPRHRDVRSAMPAIVVLPELARSVRYDWRTGALVKAAPIGWRERFSNLVHGYPPAADAAYARVLAGLDHDPEQRKLADYFEHTYADRSGGVYAGVTLFEAWYAGDTIEMPDVDAIAYAVKLRGDRSFQSPIPGDHRRDRLYEFIKRSALSHRKYRTMLEAAAAAFVRAEPDMDPMYARLAPRFHYLFATHEDDLDRVRGALAKLGSRDALIESVDSTVVADPQAMDRRERRKEELAAMEQKIRALAIEKLAAADH